MAVVFCKEFSVELVYPQNDKIGILEVPEIKSFFAAQLC